MKEEMSKLKKEEEKLKKRTELQSMRKRLQEQREKVQNLRGTIHTFDISSDKQSKKTNKKSPVQGQKSAHGISIEDNSDKSSKKRW